MIRKALKAVGWMLLYGSAATLIAQAILLVLLARSWQIDSGRAMQALAVAQGVDLSAMDEESPAHPGEVSHEHVSMEQVLDARALKLRDLELREMSLTEGLAELDRRQRELSRRQQDATRLKETFESELLAIQQKAVAQGIEDTRAKLMAIKPAQAKLLLDDLLERGDLQTVVTLIRGMPDTKSSKIIAEFKSEKDLERIGEILRLIIEGDAVADLAATTVSQLDNPTTASQ